MSKIALFCGNITLYFILSFSLNDEEKFNTIFKSLFFGAVVISLYGILQSLDILEAPKEFYGEKNPGSTFNRTNQAAQYLVCIIPYFLVKAFESPFKNEKEKLTPVYKLAWIMGTLIILLYFIMIQIRASWIGLFVSLLFLSTVIFKSRQDFGIPTKIKDTKRYLINKKKYFIMLVVIPLIILSGISITFLTRAINSTSLNESSLAFRVHTWKSTISLIKDNPWFGVGPGNYETFLPKYQTKELSTMKIKEGNRTAFAHNDVLQTLSEFGIFGTLIFLSILIIVTKHFFEIVKNKENIKEHLSYTAAYAGILGLFTHSLLSYNFQFPVPLVAFVILVAYIERGAKKYKNNSKTISFNKRIAYLIYAIPVVITSFTIYLSYNRTFSEIYFADAMNTKKHMSLKTSLPKFSKAIKFNSYNDLAYFNRGVSRGKLEMWDEALFDLKKSLKIFPYKGETHRQIAIIYAKLKDKEKAINSFNLALKVTPELNEIIEKDIKRWMKKNR